MVRFYSKKCRWPSEGGLKDRANKALRLKEAVLNPPKQAVLTLHGGCLSYRPQSDQYTSAKRIR